MTQGFTLVWVKGRYHFFWVSFVVYIDYVIRVGFENQSVSSVVSLIVTTTCNGSYIYEILFIALKCI